MADQRDLDFLCYKANGVALAYKHGGAKLIYKIAAGLSTVVTFAWGSDVKDLDILAYWDGAPDLTAGYNHGTGGTSGCYSLSWSGDVTSEDSSEWVKILMSPLSGSTTRTFRVHFNVYGHDDSHPGSTCTVIASQDGGETLIKRNQSCSTNAKQAAATSDPCCVVTFDATGKLVSLE